jgi:hypothetical protein
MSQARLGRAAGVLGVFAAVLFGLGALATLSPDLPPFALARFALFGFMFWAFGWSTAVAARNSS